MLGPFYLVLQETKYEKKIWANNATINIYCNKIYRLLAMNITEKNGLKINTKLLNFVNHEAGVLIFKKWKSLIKSLFFT